MRSINGLALNDWPHPVTRYEGGRQVWKCPIYTCWRNMLTRCLTEEGQERQPTYKAVDVCEEWLSFTSFRAWAASRWVEGYELDKDIIDPSSRVYSPETCCFVSQAVNRTLHAKTQGSLPIGVSYDRGLYKARIMDAEGNREYLGSNKDMYIAHLMWQSRKIEILSSFAYDESDPNIKRGLWRIIDKITDDIRNGRITRSFKEV